ncbi:MAG: hypothetical protein WCO18_00165 [bacterium]
MNPTTWFLIVGVFAIIWLLLGYTGVLIGISFRKKHSDQPISLEDKIIFTFGGPITLAAVVIVKIIYN